MRCRYSKPSFPICKRRFPHIPRTGRMECTSCTIHPSRSSRCTELACLKSEIVFNSRGHLSPCLVRAEREIPHVCPVRPELREGKICSAIIENYPSVLLLMHAINLRNKELRSAGHLSPRLIRPERSSSSIPERVEECQSLIVIPSPGEESSVYRISRAAHDETSPQPPKAAGCPDHAGFSTLQTRSSSTVKCLRIGASNVMR